MITPSDHRTIDSSPNCIWFMRRCSRFQSESILVVVLACSTDTMNLAAVEPAVGPCLCSRPMPSPAQTEITLRLAVERPVIGVAYSLQDKASKPVDIRMSDGRVIVFDFPIRVAEGPKFYGAHVRREGSERRFVYIATGQQAGQKESGWSRRMKIDIHTIPEALLAKVKAGMVLEAAVNGAGPDGSPACATTQLLRTWRVVD